LRLLLELLALLQQRVNPIDVFGALQALRREFIARRLLEGGLERLAGIFLFALRERLLALQHGRAPDVHGWMHAVPLAG
jgi:hypothetical protein